MERKPNPDEALKKEPVHQKNRQHVVLRMGGWKELFEPDKYKYIVARALNKCTWYAALVLNGYLITNNSAYLIIEIEKEELEEMLTTIHGYLKLEIEEHHVAVKQLDFDGYIHIDNYRTEMLLINLFDVYPLYDDMLVHLLTGRSIDLPYSAPAIEKLKNKVNSAVYCSAVDYTGAASPVIVQVC